MSIISLSTYVDMSGAATPSTGIIMGLDLDGTLKQKGTSGAVTEIGSGGGGSAGTSGVDGKLIERFERVTGKKAHHFMRRGLVFSHQDIEKVLDEVSFNASDNPGETIIVDERFVQKNLGNLVIDTDLSKFIL